MTSGDNEDIFCSFDVTVGNVRHMMEFYWRQLSSWMICTAFMVQEKMLLFMFLSQVNLNFVTHRHWQHKVIYYTVDILYWFTRIPIFVGLNIYHSRSSCIKILLWTRNKILLLMFIACAHLVFISRDTIVIIPGSFRSKRNLIVFYFNSKSLEMSVFF